MPHYNGWLPRKRDDIIHRGDAWNEQIGLRGLAGGIPQERITGFKDRLAQTKALFAEVKTAGRNSINTGQCRVSCGELELELELAALLPALRCGSSTPILPRNGAPGLSRHNTGGHGMPVKLFIGGVPPDERNADHCCGKRGRKPAGRWAAAADSRLICPCAFPRAAGGANCYSVWRTPRKQGGPYCPTVPRIIA